MVMFLLGVVVGVAILVPAAWLFGRRSLARFRADEQRAREAERLVSTLAGGLAHEIKNPLSTMNLNLQLLAEDWREADTPEGQRAGRRIRTMQTETQRLAEILEDFLRFVRADQIHLQRCDVNEVLEETVAFLTPKLRAQKIEVLKSLSDLPEAWADPALLKQAILNILINAEQAMPDGGDLRIRSVLDGDTIQMDVTDTGKGIAPEDQERVFAAYYSRRKNGSGLGLPTARRIVEKHGGEIRAHGEPDQGSCFTIRLPVLTRPPADSPPPERETRA